MNRELQIKLAQKIWTELNGSITSYLIYNQREYTHEENMAIQDLIKKLVIKRNGSSLSVSSQTYFFLKNNGRTEREIKEDEEKDRKEQELQLSKEANAISKKSMLISGVALFISFTSICITIFKTNK